MKKKKENTLSNQHFKLVKCIFQGMTIPQIAQNMCCSQSCISYHLNQLYSKYKAKGRNEFVLNVFGEIIDNYKNTISQKEESETSLQKQIENSKKILKGLILNKKNPELFEYWSLEAQKFL